MANLDADVPVELVNLTNVSFDELCELDDEYLNDSLRRVIRDSEHRDDSVVVASFSPPPLSRPDVPYRIDA